MITASERLDQFATILDNYVAFFIASAILGKADVSNIPFHIAIRQVIYTQINAVNLHTNESEDILLSKLDKLVHAISNNMPVSNVYIDDKIVDNATAGVQRRNNTLKIGLASIGVLAYSGPIDILPSAVFYEKQGKLTVRYAQVSLDGYYFDNSTTACPDSSCRPLSFFECIHSPDRTDAEIRNDIDSVFSIPVLPYIHADECTTVYRIDDNNMTLQDDHVRDAIYNTIIGIEELAEEDEGAPTDDDSAPPPEIAEDDSTPSDDDNTSVTKSFFKTSIELATDETIDDILYKISVHRYVNTLTDDVDDTSLSILKKWCSMFIFVTSSDSTRKLLKALKVVVR